VFSSPIPLKSIYREVIDFSSKVNFDNYVQAGWQPIEAIVDLDEAFVARKVIPRYRVGWLRGGGEPPRPPIIDEVPSPRFQDFGPSAN
jgi:hypothetical protein